PADRRPRRNEGTGGVREPRPAHEAHRRDARRSTDTAEGRTRRRARGGEGGRKQQQATLQHDLPFRSSPRRPTGSNATEARSAAAPPPVTPTVTLATSFSSRGHDRRSCTRRSRVKRTIAVVNGG